MSDLVEKSLEAVDPGKSLKEFWDENEKYLRQKKWEDLCFELSFHYNDRLPSLDNKAIFDD